ncbi:MAG: FABP family protein [Ignavibacteria bacterium]|nr:FABP family protein [Ignavibacteria bacterium]
MIEQLNFLLGVWKGEGHASYPTIKSTDYTEELSFERVEGDKSIQFLQKTWYKSDGNSLHFEAGYFIAEEDGSFTFLNAQNSNRTEVMRCRLESSLKLICELKEIGNDERPVKTRREFFIEDGFLKYKLFLQTRNQPFQLHLEAKLKKFNNA